MGGRSGVAVHGSRATGTGGDRVAAADDEAIPSGRGSKAAAHGGAPSPPCLSHGRVAYQHKHTTPRHTETGSCSTI